MVEVPVVMRERVPTVPRVPKTVEFAQVQYDRMVDVPVALQRQICQIQEQIEEVVRTIPERGLRSPVEQMVDAMSCQWEIRLWRCVAENN